MAGEMTRDGYPTSDKFFFFSVTFIAAISRDVFSSKIRSADKGVMEQA